MEKSNTKNAFQQALICSILKDYDALLAEAPNIEASENMKAWMQNDIKEKKTHLYRTKIVKTLLVAVLLITLLAFTTIAVPAAREAFIKFFIEVSGQDHYAITFDPEQAAAAPAEIKSTYRIYYIPSAYTIANYKTSTTTNTAIWIADDGSFIQYTQRILPENPTADTWMGLDYTGPIEHITVNGYIMQRIKDKESCIWIWTNNEYVFTLKVPISLPQNDTTQILESWAFVP